MMQITRKGELTTVEGTQPEIGQLAPEFALYNLNNERIKLSDLRGQKVLISVFPDINTRICDLQTKRFFQLASKLKDTHIVNVSNNTEVELRSWCATEGIESEMLIDEELTFAHSYGLWMPEFKRLARSVFVIDAEGVLTYSEIVPEMAQEPNYQAAIAAAE